MSVPWRAPVGWNFIMRSNNWEPATTCLQCFCSGFQPFHVLPPGFPLPHLHTTQPYCNTYSACSVLIELLLVGLRGLGRHCCPIIDTIQNLISPLVSVSSFHFQLPFKNSFSVWSRKWHAQTMRISLCLFLHPEYSSPLIPPPGFLFPLWLSVV